MRSKFERDVAKAFRKAEINFVYEPEVVHFVQPKKDRKYIPDFRIRTKKGYVCFVETKGRLTREDRQKLMWIREQHPKMKLILLFMNSDVRLAKNSPTSYGQWATKVGFTWFDYRKGLPKEWT